MAPSSHSMEPTAGSTAAYSGLTDSDSNNNRNSIKNIARSINYRSSTTPAASQHKNKPRIKQQQIAVSILAQSTFQMEPTAGSAATYSSCTDSDSNNIKNSIKYTESSIKYISSTTPAAS